MRTTLKRGLAATAVMAVTSALFLGTAPGAWAFDAGPLASVVNGNSGLTTGTNFDSVRATAPAACDATATRHSIKITTVTATLPANQALADAWANDLLYSPSNVGLPGPITGTSNGSWQQIADAFGQQLVPGVYHFILQCGNNLSTTFFEQWSGGVTFTSPTAWTSFVGADPPAPLVATTTSLTAAPNPATDAQTVTLTATVNESNAATPTGNVEFFNGATSLGTSAVNGSAVATLPVGPLAAGSYNLRAVYAGNATFATSEGTTTLTVTGAPVPAANTATALTVSPTSGPAYQAVTAQGVVTNTTTPAVVPVGTCRFLDGAALLATSPVNGSGVCTFTSSSFFGPGHAFTIQFVPTDTNLFNPSTSNEVTASYDAPTFLPDEQTVVVTVPAGNLTIFTPYTETNPLDLGNMVLAGDGSSFGASAVFDHVTVTDTRAGNPGWVASLTRADFVGASPADTIPAQYSGFENVSGSYIAGNAIQAGDVTFADIPAGTPSSGPAPFATTTVGNGTGTVDIFADFVLEGVPTSTKPGLYTTTVTFTVA